MSEDAVRTLCSARDPIVLDPLKVLLERGGYHAELAAKGIRNVGDARARRILADYAARNPSTNAGRLAAQYVRDLEKRSKDHPN